MPRHAFGLGLHFSLGSHVIHQLLDLTSKILNASGELQAGPGNKTARSQEFMETNLNFSNLHREHAGLPKLVWLDSLEKEAVDIARNNCAGTNITSQFIKYFTIPIDADIIKSNSSQEILKILQNVYSKSTSVYRYGGPLKDFYFCGHEFESNATEASEFQRATQFLLNILHPDITGMGCAVEKCSSGDGGNLVCTYWLPLRKQNAGQTFSWNDHFLN